MKKIRFGILGASRISRKAVIPVLTNSNFAELTCVGSSSPDKAKDLNLPILSYEELIQSPDIDAVYVSLPNSMHEEWAIRALEAKKHVWCEKPAALTYGGAKRMVLAASKNGVRLMEGFMYQHHPQHAKVREMLASGVIGDVTGLKARIAYPRPAEDNIRLKSELGGGFYFDALVYPIHASRMVFQDEPVLVESSMEFENSIDISDTMTLEFTNGKRAEISGQFSEDYASTYEVIGTKGSIRLARAYAVPRDMPVDIYVNSPAGHTEYRIEPFDHFVPLAQTFCEEIASDTSTRQFEQELLRQAKVVDAGWRSAHEHKTIKIADL